MKFVALIFMLCISGNLIASSSTAKNKDCCSSDEDLSPRSFEEKIIRDLGGLSPEKAEAEIRLLKRKKRLDLHKHPHVASVAHLLAQNYDTLMDARILESKMERSFAAATQSFEKEAASSSASRSSTTLGEIQALILEQEEMFADHDQYVSAVEQHTQEAAKKLNELESAYKAQQAAAALAQTQKSENK